MTTHNHSACKKKTLFYSQSWLVFFLCRSEPLHPDMFLPTPQRSPTPGFWGRVPWRDLRFGVEGSPPRIRVSPRSLRLLIRAREPGSLRFETGRGRLLLHSLHHSTRDWQREWGSGPLGNHTETHCLIRKSYSADWENGDEVGSLWETR